MREYESILGKLYGPERGRRGHFQILSKVWARRDQGFRSARSLVLGMGRGQHTACPGWSWQWAPDLAPLKQTLHI